jgi:hypothetical protein
MADTYYILAEHLGPVRLPRLERLAVGGGSLHGVAARRAALPVMHVMELSCCGCDSDGCRTVVGCTDPETSWRSCGRRGRAGGAANIIICHILFTC